MTRKFLSRIKIGGNDMQYELTADDVRSLKSLVYERALCQQESKRGKWNKLALKLCKTELVKK